MPLQFRGAGDDAIDRDYYDPMEFVQTWNWLVNGEDGLQLVSLSLLPAIHFPKQNARNSLIIIIVKVIGIHHMGRRFIQKRSRDKFVSFKRQSIRLKANQNYHFESALGPGN